MTGIEDGGGGFHYPTPACYHIEQARNARLQARIDAALRLADKWDEIAEGHGVRNFTGNDHRLFAKELRAAIKAQP